MISIVISTYNNEEKNIHYIVEKIKGILKNLNYEIVFVDDSKNNNVEFWKKKVRKIVMSDIFIEKMKED